MNSESSLFAVEQLNNAWNQALMEFKDDIYLEIPELEYALEHLNRVLKLSMIKGVNKLVHKHQRSIHGVTNQFGIEINLENLSH